MKRKIWTSEEIERARELLKTQFYREKVLKGYTPPPNSKYTHKKEKNISLDF